jgi:hypothetical protein
MLFIMCKLLYGIYGWKKLILKKSIFYVIYVTHVVVVILENHANC